MRLLPVTFRPLQRLINENIEQSSTALKQANNAIYSGNVGLLLMGNYYSESEKAHVLKENDDS